MANINKKIIKPMKIAWKKCFDGDSSSHYYTSKAWNRLRNLYISLHPICEECIKHGHVEPATEIHHLRPFMSEKTEEARWNTLLNESNLIAVCNKCHYAYHYKLRRLHLSETHELTQEEWEQAQQRYGNIYGRYEFDND
jgi:hypothetical protein